jgi:hypothetical protein
MKTPSRIISVLLLAWAASTFAWPLHAEGIPEPGIVLYGEVRNLNTLFTNRPRLTFGELDWPVRAGGKTLRLRVGLTNLAGNLSYRVRIPFETVVGGNSEGPASFVLNAAATDYTSETIVYRAGTNALPATIQSFTTNSVTTMAVYNFNAAKRGLVQRVDLAINNAGIAPARGVPGTSEVGLPGWAGGVGNGGQGEVPGFQFTSVGAHPDGGVRIEWTGAPTAKTFYLLRAEVLDEGLGSYGIVKVFPKGSPAGGTFHDAQADAEGSYFYRLWAE